MRASASSTRRSSSICRISNASSSIDSSRARSPSSNARSTSCAPPTSFRGEHDMSPRVPAPREVNAVGEIVGVYEYGDPDGAPVMVFHGTPACGAGFAWADEPARVRGLRLIAPDRPGVGLSSRIASWTVADYPQLVTALADTLGVDRFAVWGYSGGGPYAAACA